MAGEKFADNGSDALSSVVKEDTNRYNYDNNLWVMYLVVKQK